MFNTPFPFDWKGSTYNLTVPMMLRKILRPILILLGISLLFFLGWWIVTTAAFGGFDRDYSVADLREHFEERETDIYALKNYFNHIVPEHQLVDIEFETNETIERLGIQGLDSNTLVPNTSQILEWELKTNSAEAEHLMVALGWTSQTLDSLKKMLDKAGCISIQSGEPTRIGFQRSGLGLYFFNVFNQAVPVESRMLYKDSCTYIWGNEKLVLEYRGGAVGHPCFFDINQQH